MLLNDKIQIRQLFDRISCTYTYFIWNKQNELLIIDPVIETFQRDEEIIKELNLKPRFVLETHLHADHITSANSYKSIYNCKLVIGSNANTDNFDIKLEHNSELELLEQIKIKTFHTPGHTNCSSSYLLDNCLFTGDTLLIRGCGRTDFQEGSSQKLYESINLLYELGDNIFVFPGHDYQGRMFSTIDEEKAFNKRVNINTRCDEFIETMKNLKLDKPKMIDIAVPANSEGGK